MSALERELYRLVDEALPKAQAGDVDKEGEIVDEAELECARWLLRACDGDVAKARRALTIAHRRDGGRLRAAALDESWRWRS